MVSFITHFLANCLSANYDLTEILPSVGPTHHPLTFLPIVTWQIVTAPAQSRMGCGCNMPMYHNQTVKFSLKQIKKYIFDVFCCFRAMPGSST